MARERVDIYWILPAGLLSDSSVGPGAISDVWHKSTRSSKPLQIQPAGSGAKGGPRRRPFLRCISIKICRC